MSHQPLMTGEPRTVLQQKTKHKLKLVGRHEDPGAMKGFKITYNACASSERFNNLRRINPMLHRQVGRG